MTVLALWALLTGAALAEEPVRFSLDTVLVSRLDAPYGVEDLEATALRLQRVLEARMSAGYLAVPLSEVAPFEDYDANTYLASCPDDELLGCAYVIGARAPVEWVITGRVSEGEQGTEVYIAFVDVVYSKAMFGFTVLLDALDDDQTFVDAVVEAFEWILNGGGRDKDERARETDDERARRDREVAAGALEELERELGGLVRADSAGDVREPRVTRKDLEGQYADRDDARPWERLQMTEAQFVRYRNSGQSLPEWRERLRGRAGALLLRAGGGAGSGPFAQFYDGRFAYDDQLEIVEVQAFQEVVAGAGWFVDLEAGVGIHPLFDLSVRWAARVSGASFLFHQEFVGEPEPPREPGFDTALSHELGVRGTVAPMPTWPVRPTGTLGVAYWVGKPMERVVQIIDPFPVFPRPRFVFLEVVPGAEAAVSRWILLQARLVWSIPVAGTWLQQSREGDNGIATRGVPTGNRAGGVEGSIGFTVRLPVVRGPGPR